MTRLAFVVRPEITLYPKTLHSQTEPSSGVLRWMTSTQTGYTYTIQATGVAMPCKSCSALRFRVGKPSAGQQKLPSMLANLEFS